MQLKNRAKRELEIIKGNRFFLGRTAWDRAFLQAHNPKARYFYGGELLRKAFWRDQWDIQNVKRYRIVFTNAYHPRKGAEVLLDAVKILKPLYHDIQICLIGETSGNSGYGRYLRRRMNEMRGCIVEKGRLNAKDLVNELVSSHVFISPSYIDNSPNAVCEAQLLGMPVISSFTGGVPSLIEDKQSGLFFATGDAPMLALKIQEIFEDDDLAVRLSRQARNIALHRHSPESVVSEILAVYEAIVRNAV